MANSQRFKTPFFENDQIEPIAIVCDNSVSQPPTSFALLLSRFKAPSWLVSFTLHLGLLLVLAFWIFPDIKNSTIAVLSENVVAEPVSDIQFVIQPVDVPDLQLDEDLQVSELQDLEPLEDIVIEELSSSFDVTETLTSDLTELPISRSGRNALDPGASSQHAAAREIQDQVSDAGGENGEVQFSLVWKTISDVDLHVITPVGERISYLRRRANCHGLLDVDRNASETTTTPVENIRWLEGEPRSGRYTVLVHLYRSREPRNEKIKYELLAKTGDSVDLSTSYVSLRNRIEVRRFYYFAPSISEFDRTEELARLKRLQAREEAVASKILESTPRFSPNENRQLSRIILRYPHTDAAIEAMQRLAGRGIKN